VLFEDEKIKFWVLLLDIAYKMIKIITTFNCCAFCLFPAPNFNKIDQQLYNWSLTTQWI